MTKEYDDIKEGRYIRKTKDFSKPCPKCGAIMEFDVIKLRNLRPSKKTKYEIIYDDCPNNCSLRFEDIFQNIDTEEQIIWYEEEKDDDL